MSEAEAIHRTYAAHLAGGRDVSPASVERERGVLKARFGRWLPEDREADMVDVGCWYGSLLYFLQRAGYRRARGVDMNPDLLTMAENLGAGNLECHEALDYLKSHPATFDRIFAMDLVEHLPKERILPFLETARRALKPGGRFIMQAPNGDGPFGSRYRYEDFSHTVAFTGTSVRQALTASGFTEVEVVPVEPVVHGVKSLARRVLWQGIKTGLRLYLMAETGSAGGAILTQNLIAVAGADSQAGG